MTISSRRFLRSPRRERILAFRKVNALLIRNEKLYGQPTSAYRYSGGIYNEFYFILMTAEFMRNS